MVGDVRAEADDDEVDVLRQPADGEYHHDQDHHLHNLHQRSTEHNMNSAASSDGCSLRSSSIFSETVI